MSYFNIPGWSGNPFDFPADFERWLQRLTALLNRTWYEDIRITPGSFDRPGISDPTFVAKTPGGGATTTYLCQFDVGNLASFSVQIPHSYIPGEDIKAHVHWTPAERGAAEGASATVGWKVDYSWANINGAFGAMATVDLSDACDGIDWQHQMTSDITITGTSKGISSMLVCNIKRTDTGTDDTWATNTSGNRPIFLEMDFHIPCNTIGSREWAAK
jgi:hypothetical protein